MGSDRKISELSSLTGANAADTDLVHVVDISEAATVDQNKSITMAELATKVNAINVGLTSFTPTYSVGFGTVTNDQWHYNIINGMMSVYGRLTAGTTTTANATITLPSGYKIHTALTATIYLAQCQMSTITTVRDHVLVTGGDTHFELSRAGNGSDALAVMQTNNGVVTGWTISMSFTVPIEAV